MMSRAVDLYVKIAFSGLPPKVPPPTFGMEYDEGIERYLDRFESETSSGARAKLHRYVLRLGNNKYPFMKFVLQEHLIQDEYIFLVDTHDNMFDMASSEFDELRKIREFNREIKERIESLWVECDIPTLVSLKKLVAGSASIEERARYKAYQDKAILVVDDNPIMAET
ncbi:MAG: hypothetical protein KJ645_11155, partial [Planctomycetes bacterium]|nr:hypothetical protein [Planctomycetota bacterium]